VILVDQSPIGRTPRSESGDLYEAFDDIREIFAETRDAGQPRIRPAIFHSIWKPDAAPICQGSGVVIVEMQFLADVELVCEDCKGTRFKKTPFWKSVQVKKHCGGPEPDGS